MTNIFRLKVLFTILLFSSISTTAYAACSVNLPGSQYDQRVDGRSIDQAVFNNAVLHYTNLLRCRRGLRAFQAAQEVLGAAVTHSTNMAATRTYSHEVNRRGARTLRDRLRRQNANFRYAAENIAKTFVYALNGRGFIQSGSCNFRYMANNQNIPPHTYRTLAQELVTSWENSSGHRENIFSRRFTRMGAGLGIVKNTPLCGELYASQVFTG
ncbi:MAG: hypothetical protein JKY31_10460 [Rhodobacteraceae bacterium]|nr:hypothetical protein [Paracoccaceae bacterium]